MLKSNFNKSDDQREEKYLLKNIVKLQKDWNGVVHARSSINDDIVESRIPSAKSRSIQHISRRIVNQCQPEQGAGQLSNSMLVANLALLKKPNEVQCILLTVLGILLISKRKKLIGFAKELGNLFKTK